MKKFSKKLVWYRLIVNILISFIIGSFAFSSFMPEEGEVNPETIKLALIFFVISFIVSYIIFSIYQVLYYKTSGYELKEKEIVCVRGVLFKKKSILEYAKIHAVNSKQNIIEKMFGISTLQVDSGSTNTAHTAEIQIIEDKNIVNALMKTIKAKQNNEEVCLTNNDTNQEDKEINDSIKNIYKFDSKRKVIYSALQVAWVIVGGLFSLIIGLFAMIALVILKEMDLPLLLIVLGGALVIILIISIIGFIFGLIGSLLTYYDFKLIRNKNDIEVSYGLITKINNTFKFNKIKAVRITQSLIQKLFGFATIKVEVIGYTMQSNDENKGYSTGILVPLCKKSEVNSILNNLLPDYIPLEKEVKSKYYFPFVSYHLLFSFISFILAQVVLSIFLIYYNFINELLVSSFFLWTLYIVYILIILLERKLAQINSGLNVDNDKLCIYRGSIVLETIVMRKNNIIGIDEKTTHYREKKNIYTYKIHFKSNSSTNTVIVLNVDKPQSEEIYKLLKY